MATAAIHFQCALKNFKRLVPDRTVKQAKIASWDAEHQYEYMTGVQKLCKETSDVVYVVETLNIYVPGVPKRPIVVVDGTAIQFARVGVCVIVGETFTWLPNSGNADAVRRLLESFFSGCLHSQCPICFEESNVHMAACCHCGKGVCIGCMGRWNDTCPFCRYEYPTNTASNSSGL